MNVVANDKIFRRQLIELQKLHKKEFYHWEKKYLLDKIITISTHVDIYEHCSSKIMTFLKTNHFNETQFEAMNYVRHLFNEIKIITSSIITNKTFFIVKMLQSFLLKLKKDRINDKKRAQSRVLFCTFDNTTANDFATRLFERAQRDERTKKAMIIHMHSIIIEKAALKFKKLKEFSFFIDEIDSFVREIFDQNLDEIMNLSQLSIASIVHRAFHESQKRSYEMTNKRYILHKMSLVTWMLRVVDFMNQTKSAIADFV